MGPEGFAAHGSNRWEWAATASGRPPKKSGHPSVDFGTAGGRRNFLPCQQLRDVGPSDLGSGGQIFLLQSEFLQPVFDDQREIHSASCPRFD
jgi:hypothetical protein